MENLILWVPKNPSNAFYRNYLTTSLFIPTTINTIVDVCVHKSLGGYVSFIKIIKQGHGWFKICYKEMI